MTLYVPGTSPKIWDIHLPVVLWSIEHNFRIFKNLSNSAEGVIHQVLFYSGLWRQSLMSVHLFIPFPRLVREFSINKTYRIRIQKWETDKAGNDWMKGKSKEMKWSELKLFSHIILIETKEKTSNYIYIYIILEDQWIFSLRRYIYIKSRVMFWFQGR